MNKLIVTDVDIRKIVDLQKIECCRVKKRTSFHG